MDPYPKFSFRSTLVACSANTGFRKILMSIFRMLLTILIVAIGFLIFEWMLGSLTNLNPIEKVFLGMMGIVPGGIWLVMLGGCCLMILLIANISNRIPSEWVLSYWRERVQRLAFGYPSIRLEAGGVICQDADSMCEWVTQKENEMAEMSMSGGIGDYLYRSKVAETASDDEIDDKHEAHNPIDHIYHFPPYA